METLEMVKILEITRVPPSSDSPNSAKEFALPLTFFDIYWLKFPPVQCLYFYQLTESTSTPSYFYSKVIPRLKQSLSLVLVQYLPLAGNLIWPPNAAKPIISYMPNDGVSLTVAESNVNNFNILTSNEMYQANVLHTLASWLISSDDKAEIMSFQITLFPGEGFCVGGTVQHGVADGKTATMFTRAWAYLCKQLGNVENPDLVLPPDLTPCFGRGFIKDPDGLDMVFLKQWLAIFYDDQNSNMRRLRFPRNMEVIPDEIVRASFEFTRQDIEKLKQKALWRLSNNGKPLHLSTFVLTLAYTATCLVKTKGESERSVVIDMGVNCRNRIDPSLPSNYFGACVMCFVSSAEARNFMDENGFGFAVNMISSLVQKVKKGVVKGAEKTVMNVLGPKSPELQVIAVAGEPKFSYYGSDYGFGRTKKVEFVSIDRGDVVFMAEGKDGRGGVEICLALKKYEMEKFSCLFSHELKNLISKL